MQEELERWMKKAGEILARHYTPTLRIEITPESLEEYRCQQEFERQQTLANLDDMGIQFREV